MLASNRLPNAWLMALAIALWRSIIEKEASEQQRNPNTICRKIAHLRNLFRFHALRGDT